MACRCEKCGRYCDCGEEYCKYHLIEESYKDNASRNIDVGGRFYGEDIKKESEA